MKQYLKILEKIGLIPTAYLIIAFFIFSNRFDCYVGKLADHPIFTLVILSISLLIFLGKVFDYLTEAKAKKELWKTIRAWLAYLGFILMGYLLIGTFVNVKTQPEFFHFIMDSRIVLFIVFFLAAHSLVFIFSKIDVFPGKRIE